MPLLAQTTHRAADPALQGAVLIFVILFVALLGLLTIILLLVVWRRYNARLRAPRSEASASDDPWAVAGQRVATDENEEEDDDDRPEKR